MLDLMSAAKQLVIPIYQRTYSWTRAECAQLWRDILRAGSDDQSSGHFVGSIVHVEQGLGTLVTQEPNLVIDGQQRLTSTTLLIIALANALENLPVDLQEPLEGFSPKKLRNAYLINHVEEGEKYFRLLLSQADRETLKALVVGEDLPTPISERVKDNYEFFVERLADPRIDLAAVCRGLAKLVVVDMRLDRTTDNPQLIFESMNSTGKQLSEADLIRNFVLMGLAPAQQERLYRRYWRPMETDFGQAAYESQFDSFVRHYLTVVTGGNIPREREVYEAFKAHANYLYGKGQDVETLVSELRAYSRRYCAIALGAEPDIILQRAFQDLREIRADVVYPFLLEVYTDYDTGRLTTDDMVEIVGMVTSYIIRRAVCRIPTNSLNTTFATFGKALRKDAYLDSVKAHLLAMKSYRRFPDDQEFSEYLVTSDLYHFKRRSYFLRHLENHGRKEYVPIEDYTIEHIMPQNPDLNPQWKESLGPDWQEVHETYLHTLGNLTLTGYNSEYSDHAFEVKRDMEGGFRDSPLRLNRGLGDLDTWNAETIRSRAQRLAAQASHIWARPVLPAEELANLAETPARPQYTLADHPHLHTSTRLRLFNDFRTEVLSWDPDNITEHVLKQYIAYKAETNFVDVVPQASRLRLTLNIPFEALRDDRGLAIDVTGRGHWGNGNVEVPLDEGSDFAYVMGLVRQSFETQMAE